MQSSKPLVLGKLPPDSGEVRFVIPVAPVSLQASRARKNAVTAAIRAVTKTAEFIFTDDVQVEIQWAIRDTRRYERDSAADVDNIVKPILDALSGPEGIIVDDCQVQSLTSYWVGWECDDEQIEVYVRLSPSGSSFPKKTLFFAHLGKALCLPLGDDFGPEIDGMFLNQVEMLLKRRDELFQLTGNAALARLVTPSQRFFHRSRLGDFRVVEARDVKRPKRPTTAPVV